MNAGNRKPGYLLLWLLCCALCLQVASAQEITRKEADALLFRLQRQPGDGETFNLLLRLAWFQILKPGELKTDLDSAKNYISRAGAILPRLHTPESTGFFNLVYSDYYKESGQRQQADLLLDKATAYLQAGKDQTLLGYAYQERMYRTDGSNARPREEKLRLLRLAANSFRLGRNKRQEGDCLRLMADVNTLSGNNDQVLLELDSAKQLYQQANSGDWQQLYIIYNRYYSRMGNYKMALQSILTALRKTSIDDASGEVCELDLEAASLFETLKDFKQSLAYAKSSLVIAEKRRNVSDIYEIAYQITGVYVRMNTPKPGLLFLNRLELQYPQGGLEKQTLAHVLCGIMIHNCLKDYAKSQVYYNFLIRQIKQKKITDNIDVEGCFGPMFNYCLGSKRYGEARKIVDLWENNVKILGTPPYAKSVMLTAALMLDTATGNFKAGLYHMVQIKTIKDSLYNETQAKQLKEMEIQYQTERKENENFLQKQKIETLTEQQKRQRAEIKTTAVTRDITLLGAICAIIISGLIYRQYIEGRKNNKVVAEKNENLQHLLKENDWLLKEVHHRVKNNLQVITALLNSQSAYLEDGAALDAIMKSKSRVESISLIHQKLYKTDNYSTISMPEYILDLVKYLKSSFIDEQEVWFDCEVDPISLDVADAVPLGLIINESVTNAIKHAFVNKTGNVIKITLRRVGESIFLEVQDNGKGFDKDKKANESSFGQLLMNGLTDELGGELEIISNGGTTVRVTFNSVSSISGLTGHFRAGPLIS